jgi:hypothetical protein
MSCWPRVVGLAGCNQDTRLSTTKRGSVKRYGSRAPHAIIADFALGRRHTDHFHRSYTPLFTESSPPGRLLQDVADEFTESAACRDHSLLTEKFRLPESIIHMDTIFTCTDVNGFVLVLDGCFRRRLLKTS